MKKLLLILIAISLTASCKTVKKFKSSKQSFKDTARITWKRETDLHKHSSEDRAVTTSSGTKGSDSTYSRKVVTKERVYLDSTGKKPVRIDRDITTEETGKLQRSEHNQDSAAIVAMKHRIDSTYQAQMDSTAVADYTHQETNQVNKITAFSMWWLVFACGIFFFVVQKIRSMPKIAGPF